MTRNEARRRLEGTWSFKVQSGMVVVRDEQLLRDIAHHEGLAAVESAPAVPARAWHAARAGYSHA